MIKTGFIVPVYNHGATLELVVKNLLQYELPIIVVDDGNDEGNRAFINDVAEKYSLVTLVVRKKNGGKGRAMNDGVRKARELGLTHAFQLDADAQHDTAVCREFLDAAEKNPEAVICGFPIYDESVPALRKNGREFSNNWARVVTLNKNIKDVLCGFRIYPVGVYARLLDHHAWINARMAYDVDILVHLLWKNVPLVNMGVRVTYPADGISNFRMVRDNVAISRTFTRLCIGMILRFPVLLIRAIRRRKDEKSGR